MLEMPDDAIGKEALDYSGLSDFSMSVIRQGVKFVSRDNPEAVAFIDVGRVIKVYDQKDTSLLAALQLAQQKWGGVQVKGTDEYKRRCAEIAAKNGIRVTNPELRELFRNHEEIKSPENSMSVHAMARVLGKKLLGEQMIIVTNASDGKEYSGPILGILEKNGYFYAAQHLGENHIILHDADRNDLPALKALVGQEVEITSDNGSILNILDSQSLSKRLERNRGWSR
jgi:hypothetical protein